MVYGSYEVMVGNKAAAVACKLARVQVAAAFPITPQTTITEYLSEMYAKGDWDFDFVNVEGEESAQLIVQGASRTGARTFTCTVVRDYSTCITRCRRLVHGGSR